MLIKRCYNEKLIIHTIDQIEKEMASFRLIRTWLLLVLIKSMEIRGRFHCMQIRCHNADNLHSIEKANRIVKKDKSA